MILLIDTSTPTCQLSFVDGEEVKDFSWEANRELAHGLNKFIEEKLGEVGKTLRDIEAVGVLRGSGSFTGLRIGLTVVNTMAGALEIPIVGASGDNWRQDALDRIEAGENDEIVLPEYASEANITKPRK